MENKIVLKSQPHESLLKEKTPVFTQNISVTTLRISLIQSGERKTFCLKK